MNAFLIVITVQERTWTTNQEQTSCDRDDTNSRMAFSSESIATSSSSPASSNAVWEGGLINPNNGARRHGFLGLRSMSDDTIL